MEPGKTFTQFSMQVPPTQPEHVVRLRELNTVAGRAATASYDASCAYAGGVFVLASPLFPAPLPERFSVVFTAPAAYAAGDSFRIGERAFALFYPDLREAEADVFAAGAVVRLEVDGSNGRAFFRCGGGGSSAAGGGWNIYTAANPPKTGAVGLHVPDATAPTNVVIDRLLSLGENGIIQMCCNSHALFLTGSGNVYSCGINKYGQLGRAVAESSASFVNLGKIEGLPKIKRIACGDGFSVFLSEAGEVYTCGTNYYGTLGRAVSDGSVTSINLDKIPGLPKIKEIGCGNNQSFFIAEIGDVYSCGRNIAGALGRQVASGSASFVNLGQTSGFPEIKQIIGGDGHSLFLSESGDVYSCGLNDYGQLGRETINGSVTSINLGKVEGLPKIEQIASGSNHSLFIAETGDIYSCGLNDYGQLGRVIASGSTKSMNLGQIDGLNQIIQADGGIAHSLFISKIGVVYSCGWNFVGELGRVCADGSTTSCNLGKITELTGVKEVACGSHSSIFRRASTTVFSCGNPPHGRAAPYGSPTVCNLGPIPDDAFGFPPPVSSYPEGSLLVKPKMEQPVATLYDDGHTVMRSGVEAVYQVRDGIETSLPHTVLADE